MTRASPPSTASWQPQPLSGEAERPALPIAIAPVSLGMAAIIATRSPTPRSCPSPEARAGIIGPLCTPSCWR
jgi:hypothetical protein